MFANHAASLAEAINFTQSHTTTTNTSVQHKASDKRRAQNRAAQKTYREKKKRRLEELENLATSAGLLDDQRSKRTQRQDSSSSSSDPESCRSINAELNTTPSSLHDPFTAELVLQPFVYPEVAIVPSASDDQPQSGSEADNIWQNSGANVSSTLVLASSCPSAVPNTHTVSTHPMNRSQAYPESLSACVDMFVDDTHLMTGTPAIGDQVLFQACTIQAAYLQILHHIGSTVPNPCTADGISTFYAPDISGTPDEITTVCVTQATFSHIEPDLRPTRTQILVKHTAWIDLLPFPDLRDRLIEVLAHQPSLFDEEEFCKDVADGGVVCWTSVRPGTQSAAECVAPWDSRSWEAKTWFLNKWNWLIRDESPLARNSEWWRRTRGHQLGTRL